MEGIFANLPQLDCTKIDRKTSLFVEVFHLGIDRQALFSFEVIINFVGTNDPLIFHQHYIVLQIDRIDITADLADLVANGRVLPAFDGAGPWALFDPAGVLVAVYEAFGDEAKPAVVVPRN